VDVVTGAFSFSGRYVAARLLELGREVRTLTRRPGSESPFGARVEAFPLEFADRDGLVLALRGADTLYNTYWIRFPSSEVGWSDVVANTRLLLEAASEAGVRRVVQWSVANASHDSPFGYFRAKAVAEDLLRSSGLSHAIVRPTLVFGDGEVLLNNVAWLLRRLPVFLLPGGDGYRLQPVAAEDIARAAVEVGLVDEPATLELGGPETLTFGEIVRRVRAAIGSRVPVVRTPPALALGFGRTLERLSGETLVTREELAGLRASLLVARRGPSGGRSLDDWLEAAASRLGRRLASDHSRPWR
jgi:uncharacterized protein YbjT (DUF2867 family)